MMPHRCQDVLLDSMELGHNIARNAALRENIFMMAICIELRIPLFLVGKPGSSKSLAKAVVASSMQGQASNKDLLKNFKQVSLTHSMFKPWLPLVGKVESLGSSFMFSFSSRSTCSPTSAVSSLLLRA